ncbi:UrcA family protein [Sphingopyxis sp.]|uniref:UrcA family protein n=1 Tax=Sphingopyxis sp. TaxID=1908224 RepID=UPI002B484CEA|nr:UrcA family protein [Sphingopyxis sp.]HJS10656.1 UrcA family protein [Sphingopyxis sp.]
MAKFSFLLAAPVALAGFSVPAAAEDESDRHTVVVRYDDLNLSSVAGRERLSTRVKYAVQKVCGTRPLHRRSLRERTVANRCKDNAMADADVKLAGLFNGEGTRYADRGRIIIVAAP